MHLKSVLNLTISVWALKLFIIRNSWTGIDNELFDHPNPFNQNFMALIAITYVSELMFSQAKGNLSALFSGKVHYTGPYLPCGTKAKITHLFYLTTSWSGSVKQCLNLKEYF